MNGLDFLEWCAVVLHGTVMTTKYGFLFRSSAEVCDSRSGSGTFKSRLTIHTYLPTHMRACQGRNGRLQPLATMIIGVSAKTKSLGSCCFRGRREIKSDRVLARYRASRSPPPLPTSSAKAPSCRSFFKRPLIGPNYR